jgi:hypothetical protein
MKRPIPSGVGFLIARALAVVEASQAIGRLP